jgi:hypothetical protein
MPIVRTPEQNKVKKDRYYAKLAEDSDRSLTYFFKESRKGAARRDIPFQLTEDEFRSIWKKQKGKCALSGIDLTLEHGSITTPNPTRMSIDRIDSEYGYTASNVQLITWQLNSAKNVWSNQQLIEVCKLVAAKNL